VKQELNVKHPPCFFASGKIEKIDPIAFTKKIRADLSTSAIFSPFQKRTGS
jgi:hypothetical protein